MKAALIALALLATSAHAATLSLTSDTSSIVVGQSITFSVVIPPELRPVAISNCALCYLQNYGVTSAVFHAGDGQTSFPIGREVVSATFTYSTPGDYIATAGGTGFWNTYQCYLGTCYPLPNESAEFLFVNLTLPVHVAAVPEPATWALLLFGFAFFGLRQFWPGASHE